MPGYLENADNKGDGYRGRLPRTLEECDLRRAVLPSR